MRAQDIIKKKPYLIWYTKDYDNLNDEAVVEAVLNNGNWDDVRELIDALGISRVADIFRKQTSGKRINYRPEVKNYFSLYFAKYA